jgi:hypothetical protein
MRAKASTRAHLLLAAALCALAAPAAAGAATVVNGDFEAGNLNGWNVVNAPGEGTGNWYAYSGTANPSGEFGGEVPPPPAGNYAAIVSQGGPGSHILYQDVALEPFYSHSLSLLVYYRSGAPLTTPNPNTLAYQPPPDNQQYRVDVMRQGAPVDSVNPVDILATVFATKDGDPEELGPTLLTANLTPFGGQTVRLRFAEVDNRNVFFAGTDSISIQSTPPSNVFAFSQPTFNKKNGSARLPVAVPGGGTLTIADIKASGRKRIKAKTFTATTAGTLNLPVTPTKFARKTLKNKGKLKIQAAVTFTPTGGFPAAQARKLTLKLTPPKN